MNGRGNLAKMTITGADAVIEKLEALEQNVQPVFEEAARVGAGIIAGEVRKRLEQNLNSPRSASPSGGKFDRKKTQPTGDLLESFGITPVRRDGDGNVDAKIGFSGYDRKHVANVLKARVMESGSAKVKKRPFFRPGVNKARKKALAASMAILENALRDYEEG